MREKEMNKESKHGAAIKKRLIEERINIRQCVAIVLFALLVGTWAIAGEISSPTTGTFPVTKDTSSTNDNSKEGIQVIPDKIVSPTTGTFPVTKDTSSTNDNSKEGIQVIPDKIVSPTTGTFPVNERGNK